jgi:regulator of replication initiation timing
MKDLIEELRVSGDSYTEPLMQRAADELERLTRNPNVVPVSMYEQAREHMRELAAELAKLHMENNALKDELDNLWRSIEAGP